MGPIPELAMSLQTILDDKRARYFGVTGPYIPPAKEEIIVQHVVTHQGNLFICSGHNTGMSTVGRAIECSPDMQECGISVVYVNLEPLKSYTSEADFWEKMFGLLAQHHNGTRFEKNRMKALLKRTSEEPSALAFASLCRLAPSILLLLDGASILGEVPESIMFDLVDAVRRCKNWWESKCAGVIFMGVHSVLNVLSNHLRTINFIGAGGGDDDGDDVGHMAVGQPSQYSESLRNRRQKPSYSRGDPFHEGASSPFRPHALLGIRNFNLEELNNFLKQLKQKFVLTGAPVRVSDDWVSTAASAVHLITSGNRGLTGGCGKLLEDYVTFAGKDSISLGRLDSFIRYNLPEKLCQSSAFQPIKKALKSVTSHSQHALVQQPSAQEVLQRALTQGVVKVPMTSLPVTLLQQNVLVMVNKQGEVVANASFRLAYGTNDNIWLAVSAPIIAYSLLSQLRWPSVGREYVKHCNVPCQLDVDWLLQEVVQHLHMDTLRAEEAIDVETGQPFSYAYKAQFIVILNTLVKELARHCSNMLNYRVLVDARNLGLKVRSSPWPDILLVGEGPSLAFRIATSNETMQEHLEHAKLHHEKKFLTTVVNFLQADDRAPQLLFPKLP